MGRSRIAELVLFVCLGGCGSESATTGFPDGIEDSHFPADKLASAWEPTLPAPCLPLPGGELRAILGDNGVLVVDGAFDMKCFVEGGSPPYTCTRYLGPGEGSIPLGLSRAQQDESGCSYTGGINPDFGDAPGVYGFIMKVQDSMGSTVEVPVFFHSEEPCSTDAVAISPEPGVDVVAIGSAKSWTIDATGIDGIEAEGTCEPCFDLSILTRAPLSIAAALSCTSSGDVCSDCDDCLVGSTCPGAYTMSREIQLRSHSALRNDGPGWATLDVRATYSGSSFDPCGGKRWACHFEVLERQE